MNHYTFYDLKTGEFTNGRTYTGLHVELCRYDGMAPIEGLHDPRTSKVDLATMTVVPWAPPPPSDEAVGAAARLERDRLLAACDWVVAKSLEGGQPVPVEWRTYRQALRDVSSQSGFPHKINWPVRPG